MKDLLSASTPIGNLRGTGPLGLENKIATKGPYIFSNLISTIVGVMTMIAAIWFLILLITAAYSWMTAGGDKGAVEAARKKMLNGVIGLVITISAIFVLDLVGELIGFNLITNPAVFISDIAP